MIGRESNHMLDMIHKDKKRSEIIYPLVTQIFFGSSHRFPFGQTHLPESQESDGRHVEFIDGRHDSLRDACLTSSKQTRMKKTSI